MSRFTLTAWLYDSPLGAVAGEVRLKDLEQQGAVTVLDAITLSWVAGSDQPQIGHLRHKTGSAAAKGSVLGAVVGSLVLASVAGAAAGAGFGALVQRLKGTGIDEQILTDIRAELRPGTSALLVLSRDADPDLVRPFLKQDQARGDVTLIRADLREDAPEVLRQLLEAMPRPPAS
jgi:uncharacterized membrane protein